MEPILQIEHLSIEFIQYERRTGKVRVSPGMHKRSLPVIRDLCLEIYPGQIVAVAAVPGRVFWLTVFWIFCPITAAGRA